MSTSNFREEVLTWFDADELMSRRPNPEPGAEGNPILETGTAYAMMAWLGEATQEDADRFTRAMERLLVEGKRGIWHKKARSTDMITHDDLIGLVAGARALEKAGLKITIHREFVKYAIDNGWFISNNGDNTYTSHVKPWHRAFYMLGVEMSSGAWDEAMLSIQIIVNAFFSMDSASGKRLTYLMVKTIKGQNTFIDLASTIWWLRVRKIYQKACRIFIMFHGEKHPFSKHCPD